MLTLVQRSAQTCLVVTLLVGLAGTATASTAPKKGTYCLPDVVYRNMGNMFVDCNDNGIRDDEDVRSGALSDKDGDGLLDCEDPAREIQNDTRKAPRVQVTRLSRSYEFAFIAKPGISTITVFDIAGRQIYKTVISPTTEGRSKIRWEYPTDAHSGIYFVQLRDLYGKQSTKFIHLK